jgi:MT0933-like antitoxin protein
MPMLKKLTAIAGTAAAARSYVRKNPDKVNKMAAKAGSFIDKRTKGKYHNQIDNAVRKVATMTHQQQTTRPHTTPPPPPQH